MIGPPIPLSSAPLLKRPFDFILASAGLLLSAPLWMLIAIAIKLDDAGPVFHSEARWGRGGVAFDILKFRTTTLNPSQPGATLSPTGDRHFTRVGSFLRARGLDELPQLLNILQGDMSFVGPRPLAVEEIPAHLKSELLQDPALAGFAERLAVRPGLTGIAQIYGSKYLSHRHKFRYDRLYIRNRTFLLDLRLLALSLWLSLRGKWEARGNKL